MGSVHSVDSGSTALDTGPETPEHDDATDRGDTTEGMDESPAQSLGQEETVLKSGEEPGTGTQI